MAALGMPERMTYDFSQYRGKRGIMLADIQTLLHGIALKLGVLIYTGAVAKSLELDALRGGPSRVAARATARLEHAGVDRSHALAARQRVARVAPAS